MKKMEYGLEILSENNKDHYYCAMRHYCVLSLSLVHDL